MNPGTGRHLRGTELLHLRNPLRDEAIRDGIVGHGDYTEERRDLVAEMSLEEIVKAIRDRRSH